jgi:uncharacterized protein
MDPDVRLDSHEARLFGALIEKELTTPDQYPLSLNAAVAAANQKSNRDPVLSLSEDEVTTALERLEKKYLVRRVYTRVERFRHNGKETLGVEIPHLAILAELLMRGPQMPGELRARVSRMSPIDSIEQLMTLLIPLLERGFVRRLDPTPGSRSERYVQLLSPDLHPLDAPAATGTLQNEAADTSALLTRIDQLEVEVGRLNRRLHRLADKLGEPLEE